MRREEKFIFVFFAVAMAVAAAVGVVTYIHKDKRKNPPKYGKERRGIIKRGYFIVVPKRI